MTEQELHDLHAALALHAILSSNLEPAAHGRDVAKLAYGYADHMSAERAERKEKRK